MNTKHPKPKYHKTMIPNQKQLTTQEIAEEADAAPNLIPAEARDTASGFYAFTSEWGLEVRACGLQGLEFRASS